MMIRDQFLQLSSSPVSIDAVGAMKKFRERCTTEQNHEYYYLANLKLIDYYIELSLYEEGLLLANEDFPNIDPTVFLYIYVSYLDRLIYLSIQKRHFHLAFRYVFQKRQYINDGKRDEVNRWYLEMAYVYAELGQKTKALQHLQAIVENLPSDEILSHALSNMTKLYIDEKLIDEAETTLNQCLNVTFDVEGRTYCHYLYALISIHRGKTKDALTLFRDIFNQGIEVNYLTIAMDYLALLIQLKMDKEAYELIQTMKPMLEKDAPLETKRHFTLLSLKASLLKMPNLEAENLITCLQQLIEEEEELHHLHLTEALEEEKTNVIHEEIRTIQGDLERLVQLFPLASKETNIRSILMDFGQKLSMMIDVDEIHFGVYQPILVGKSIEQIDTYYYKNKRLYEKTITFDDLKNTIIETLLANHQEVFIDFHHYNAPMINVGTGKSYQEQGITSLFSIPFDEDESMFFSVTYGAKFNDLGTPSNRLLLRMASLLLETKIRLHFQQEKWRFDQFKCNTLQDLAHCAILIHHKDQILIDETLQKDLSLLQTTITVDEWVNLMPEKQRAVYQQAPWSMGQTFHYSLGLEQGMLYAEHIIPYPQDEDIAIGLLCQEATSLDQETQFEEAMTRVQEKTKSIEYKFSFMRLKGTIKEYQMLEMHFGVPIYFLGTDQYVIIIENETNQKTLEKIIKGFEDRVSIIRFPRDMINLQEIIQFSKIGLEEGMTFFTDEAYQRYLKKVNIRLLTTEAMKNPLEIWAQPLTTHGLTIGFEVHPRIQGCSEKENVRTFLNEDLLKEFDDKVLKATITLLKPVDYYLPVTPAVVRSDTLMKAKIANKQIHVMIYEYVPDLLDLINKCVIRQVHVLLHYHLLDQLSVFDLQKLSLQAIIIDEGLEKEKRTHLLEFASKMNWAIYSNYQFPDYENCIIREPRLLKEW